jgi:uridine phosphorylase
MQNTPNQIILSADSQMDHLKLKPEHIGETILLFPDISWLPAFSGHLDEVITTKTDQAYPFITGSRDGKKVTAIVTGIGADNMDIILNELDALVNINLVTKETKTGLTKLKILHLGLAHAIQENLAPGSFVINTMAIGFDNLLHFYDVDQNLSELTLSQELMEYLETRSEIMLFPYAAAGDTSVLKAETPGFQRCITVSSPGFYAPQNRKIRLPLAEPKMIELLKKFRFEGKVISGYSTDTAPVLALGRALDHQVLSFNVIAGNLTTNVNETVTAELKDKLISMVFDIIS